MTEPDRINELLDKVEALRDGFRLQLIAAQKAGVKVSPPVGFTQETFLQTLRDTAEDLTATLERYGRA